MADSTGKTKTGRTRKTLIADGAFDITVTTVGIAAQTGLLVWLLENRPWLDGLLRLLADARKLLGF